MKQTISTLFVCLIIIAGINCSKKAEDLPGERLRVNLEEVLTKANSACGYANPEESLRWLKDIVLKGEEDIETKKHLGNYIGQIFLTTYKNRPVVYVQMMMGSGGLPGRFFDRTGTAVFVSHDKSPQQDVLVYSNLPSL